MMGVSTVTCPECGTAVRMGLPRDSEVLSVTQDPDAVEVDGPREKRRENACPNGHTFYVYFEF